MPPKKYDTAELKDKDTGKVEKVKFKVGGLHASLKMKPDEDIGKDIMEKIKKAEVGTKMKVKGKDIMITQKIKRQATLGLNLMKRK